MAVVTSARASGCDTGATSEVTRLAGETASWVDTVSARLQPAEPICCPPPDVVDEATDSPQQLRTLVRCPALARLTAQQLLWGPLPQQPPWQQLVSAEGAILIQTGFVVPSGHRHWKCGRPAIKVMIAVNQTWPVTAMWRAYSMLPSTNNYCRHGDK